MLTAKLRAAQERIREQWYSGFSWVVSESTPWAPLAKPLSEATVALVSTCGLYRADTHVPFDAHNDLGDPSFREIHIDTPPDRLWIAHAHYDHHHVAQDPNSALPFAQFRELAAAGVIGGLHPWAYSFMGYLPEPKQLIRTSAPQVASRLAAGDVQAALLTPC